MGYVAFFSPDDFSSADRNHDGILTKDEFEHAVWHRSLSPDVEGTTAEERKEETASSFTDYDVDNSGGITSDEFNGHALRKLKELGGDSSENIEEYDDDSDPPSAEL